MLQFNAERFCKNKYERNTRNLQTQGNAKTKTKGPDQLEYRWYRTIFVEYLSNEVHASKYFGTKDTAEKDDKFGKGDGCSKLTICKVISGLMEKETNVNKPAKAMQAKIRRLVSQFKVALDKSRSTGHGIKTEGGEMNYRDYMISRFKWFFVLEPVLIDRLHFNPYVTSDICNRNNYDHSSCRSDVNDSDSISTDEEDLTNDDNAIDVDLNVLDVDTNNDGNLIENNSTDHKSLDNDSQVCNLKFAGSLNESFESSKANPSRNGKTP